MITVNEMDTQSVFVDLNQILETNKLTEEPITEEPLTETLHQVEIQQKHTSKYSRHTATK